jgi:hypothetical protein
MATIEQLQSMLDQRRPYAQAPVSQDLDLSEVVAGLSAIAERLSRSAESSPEVADPDLLARISEMTSAAAAIESAVSRISDAIRSIEIPAPVVTVEPAPVTVERPPFPRVAKIVRDGGGLMEYVLFDEEIEEEPEEDDFDID